MDRMSGGLRLVFVLLAATALLTAAATFAALGQERERVVEQASPEEIAASRLRDLTGSRCHLTAQLFMPSLEDDEGAQAALRSLTDQPAWVRAERVFAGPLADAARAFGGQVVASGEGEAWLIVEADEGPIAQHLQEVGQSRAGPVWTRVGTMTMLPDGECMLGD